MTTWEIIKAKCINVPDSGSRYVYAILSRGERLQFAYQLIDDILTRFENSSIGCHDQTFDGMIVEEFPVSSVAGLNLIRKMYLYGTVGEN